MTCRRSCARRMTSQNHCIQQAPGKRTRKQGTTSTVSAVALETSTPGCPPRKVKHIAPTEEDRRIDDGVDDRVACHTFFEPVPANLDATVMAIRATCVAVDLWKALAPN